jgi:hypothetical protein
MSCAGPPPPEGAGLNYTKIQLAPHDELCTRRLLQLLHSVVVPLHAAAIEIH